MLQKTQNFEKKIMCNIYTLVIALQSLITSGATFQPIDLRALEFRNLHIAIQYDRGAFVRTQRP